MASRKFSAEKCVALMSQRNSFLIEEINKLAGWQQLFTCCHPFEAARAMESGTLTRIKLSFTLTIGSCYCGWIVVTTKNTPLVY